MVHNGMMICSFYLKAKYSRGEKAVYALNSPYTYDDHTFEDFFEMLKEYCEKHYEYFDDEQKQKMFLISKDSIYEKDTETYRAMVFEICSGAYGVEASMTDRHTKKVNYHKGADDADIKEFKCVIYIPKDVDNVVINKGIMIFQTISTFGVKTITVDLMKKYFSGLGLSLETRSVSVKAFIENLMAKGRIKKLSFIKNRVSADKSDNIFITVGKEERIFYNPVLNNDWLNKISNMFCRSGENKIYEINDVEYEDIKITFQLEKRTRTASLRNIENFSLVEDIPESIYRNSRKDDSKLVDYMIETANEYKSKMVFTINCEG